MKKLSLILMVVLLGNFVVSCEKNSVEDETNTIKPTKLEIKAIDKDKVETPGNQSGK